MSKVILHIGTHKTASTTIQDTFRINADLLAQHGVIYPWLDNHTGHHGLVHGWKGMAKAYQLPGGSLAALQQLAKDYGNSDKTVLISSEEFSRSGPLSVLSEVREALSAFDQIEVVCMLRPQWQFLQSIYLEVSKKRLPVRPPKLVDPVIESGLFEGLWVDYNILLDGLEAVFDPGQITLVDFDSARRGEGGVLGYMLRYLGLGLPAEALEQVNGGTSNVSPMPLASWGANILSEPKVAPGWLVDQTTQALKAEYGPKVKTCLFTRDEFRKLKEHFDARNKVLSDRRAKVQPGFTLPEATTEGLGVFRHEINSSFWVQTCRGMVAQMLD